jgi:hypothetical protein
VGVGKGAVVIGTQLFIGDIRLPAGVHREETANTGLQRLVLLTDVFSCDS